jgi:hypothetical protein
MRDRRWPGLVLVRQTRLLSHVRCRALWTASIDATDAGSRARWTRLSKANLTIDFERTRTRGAQRCDECGTVASIALAWPRLSPLTGI